MCMFGRSGEAAFLSMLLYYYREQGYNIDSVMFEYSWFPRGLPPKSPNFLLECLMSKYCTLLSFDVQGMKV